MQFKFAQTLGVAATVAGLFSVAAAFGDNVGFILNRLLVLLLAQFKLPASNFH